MWPFKNRTEFEYGTAGKGRGRARRNLKTGIVEFVLWKAGEQGHKTDYWHPLDKSWFPTFRPDKQSKGVNQ